MINNIVSDTVSLDETITLFEDTFDENDSDNTDSDKQIHKWLTELKTYRTKKIFKGCKKSDISIFANLVCSSYKSIFNSSEISINKEKNGSYIIFLPSAIIELGLDEKFNQIVCVVSFHNKSNVVVVGELVNMIKDIFKGNVVINAEPFIVDDNTQEFIWGDENINKHNKIMNPLRVRHTIMYNDNSAGNC